MTINAILNIPCVPCTRGLSSPPIVHNQRVFSEPADLLHLFPFISVKDMHDLRPHVQQIVYGESYTASQAQGPRTLKCVSLKVGVTELCCTMNGQDYLVGLGKRKEVYLLTRLLQNGPPRYRYHDVFIGDPAEVAILKALKDALLGPGRSTKDTSPVPYFSENSDHSAQNAMVQTLSQRGIYDAKASLRYIGYIPHIQYSEARSALHREILAQSFGVDKEVLLKLIGSWPLDSGDQQKDFVNAIHYQAFGTNPLVLMAVARKCALLRGSHAGELAIAIKDQRFGTQSAVLVELIKNLPQFSPESFRHVCDAIRHQKFGGKDFVLIALAKYLRRIVEDYDGTDPTLKREVISLMRQKSLGLSVGVVQELTACFSKMDGVVLDLLTTVISERCFGENPESLRLVVENFPVHPATAVSFFQMIDDGIFGKDPVVQQAVLDVGSRFAALDVTSQYKFAAAIYDQKFGTDNKVLSWALLRYPVAVETGARFFRAIDNGIFGKDPSVLADAFVVATEFSFLGNDLREKYFVAIANQRFGMNLKVALEIVNYINDLGFVDGEKYFKFAIRNQVFGVDPEVLAWVVRNCRFDGIVMNTLIDAIGAGKLGADSTARVEVVKRSVEHYTDFDFDYDPWFVSSFRDAIYSQKFGKEAEIGVALLMGLSRSKNRSIHNTIIRAIWDKKFGTDTAVVSAAVSFIWHNSLQRDVHLARAVYQQAFGSDIQALGEVVPYLKQITDSQAMVILADALCERRFGDDAALVSLMLKSFPVFEYFQASDTVLYALKNNRFPRGTDLGPLIPTLAGIGAPFFQERAVSDGVFEGFLHATDQVRQLLEIPYLYHNAEFQRRLNRLPEHMQDAVNRHRKVAPNSFQFGLGYRLYSDRFLSRNPYFFQSLDLALSVEGLESMVGRANNDESQYKAIQLFDRLLIKMPYTAELFRGWLSNDYRPYVDVINTVRIYDISQIVSGYPALIDGSTLTRSHTIFNRLPAYLKVAVQDVLFDFDSDSYQYRDIINFVDTALVYNIFRDERVAGARLRDVVYASIRVAGEAVPLSSSPLEDAQFKSEIDQACQRVAAYSDFSRALTEFLDDQPKPHVAMTAYLLGVMAKKGVLGYHVQSPGERELNQANSLFYRLSAEAFSCLGRLSGEPNIQFPSNYTDFMDDLDDGVCIEALTNDFLIENPWVQAVFNKAAQPVT